MLVPDTLKPPGTEAKYHQVSFDRTNPQVLTSFIFVVEFQGMLSNILIAASLRPRNVDDVDDPLSLLTNKIPEERLRERDLVRYTCRFRFLDASTFH
jgi:hypothetical protein